MSSRTNVVQMWVRKVWMNAQGVYRRSCSVSLSLLKLSPSPLFSPSPSVSVSVSLSLLLLSDYHCLSWTPSVSRYILTVCPPISPSPTPQRLSPLPSFLQQGRPRCLLWHSGHLVFALLSPSSFLLSLEILWVPRNVNGAFLIVGKGRWLRGTHAL